jgi:uncharacterized protein (DUF849 family)
MPRPCIIAVAITGATPRKLHNPALPVSLAEQIESTHAAHEAGAAIAHLHVRHPDQTPSTEPARFAALLRGIRRHCPGMIVQFGGCGDPRAADGGGAVLRLGPDMASLADPAGGMAPILRELGIRPEIVVRDPAMLDTAVALAEAGRIPRRPHLLFVMGGTSGLPPRRDVLEAQLARLAALLPGASWSAAGTGAQQFEVASWALALGGHCRTGLEDGQHMQDRTLALSNAAMVARIAAMAEASGRRVLAAEEARALLGLPVARRLAA